MKTKPASLVIGAGNNVGNNLLKLLLSMGDSVRVAVLQQREWSCLSGLPLERKRIDQLSFQPLAELMTGIDVIYWTAGWEYDYMLADFQKIAIETNVKKMIRLVSNPAAPYFGTGLSAHNCHSDLKLSNSIPDTQLDTSFVYGGNIIGPGFFVPDEIAFIWEQFLSPSSGDTASSIALSDSRDVANACVLAAGNKERDFCLYDITRTATPQKLFRLIANQVFRKIPTHTKRKFPVRATPHIVSVQTDWIPGNSGTPETVTPFDLIPLEKSIRDTFIYAKDFFGIENFRRHLAARHI